MNENLPQTTYGGDVPAGTGGIVAIEQSRAIQEVQGAMVIAKRFPRDEIASLNRILKSCERKSLAEVSQYAYPRGGTMVTGPSIRLAEVIGQNWQNLIFGIQELSRGDGSSEVEAYAWDLEANVRVSRKFQASHVRYSKARGLTELEDPRDIYEMVANQGARRLRACILQVIPGDIAEAAQRKCDETLKKDTTESLKDRIVKMVGAFNELGVSQAMIEEKLGHPMKAVIEVELVTLRKIYTSMKDGIAKREDWFNVKAETKTQTSSSPGDLSDKVNEAKKKAGLDQKSETKWDPCTSEIQSRYGANKAKILKEECEERNIDITGLLPKPAHEKLLATINAEPGPLEDTLEKQDPEHIQGGGPEVLGEEQEQNSGTKIFVTCPDRKNAPQLAIEICEGNACGKFDTCLTAQDAIHKATLAAQAEAIKTGTVGD